MSRIAIIDLLFNWPPDGGARVDVKEVASRLTAHHEVRLFVPDYRELFPRGAIAGELPFAVTRIPFSRYSFNCVQAPLRFARAVDAFRPDHVFIADGWCLKPYLVNALKRYRPVLRFYAYECFCLRSQGTLFRDDACCSRSILDGLRECLSCIFRNGANYTRLTLFSQELYAALAFLPSYPRVLHHALANASRVLCYNDHIRNLILPYQKNVILAPSGVDTDHFSPGPEHRENRPPVILMTGRIPDRTKGFHVLREAIKLLQRNGTAFRVVIPVREAAPVCEEVITFIPWKTQEDLPPLYRDADICVVPSVGPEPFGIVALESMACGKPVVASRTGGLPLIVQDGVTGFLVPPGDPRALAEKLQILLRDSVLRKTMGTAARMRAHEFRWDKIMNDIYLPIFT
jgi:glycosyltransferase involved in cell wall biosynthesis